MPFSGLRVKSASLEKTIRPMRAPTGITWSSGWRSKATSTKPFGSRGFEVRIESAFWGSAQPRLMMFSLMVAPSIQGRETSHTLRLAAGLSEARRRVTR